MALSQTTVAAALHLEMHGKSPLAILHSQINAELLKQLYSGEIPLDGSNISVPGLSQYIAFIARMSSLYGGGVAIGLRYNLTDIRFVGISRTANGTATTAVTLTVEGDTIQTISGFFGEEATGFGNLRGIF